jgi:hypothetical protein
MDSASTSMRALAQRLLAQERANASATDPRQHEAVRVCEALRVSLSRLAGPEGFASLLRRAVALARKEAPVLETLRLKPDECLKDLEQLAADASGAGADAGAAIIAYLLELLVAFIGESLTLRLVRESWPDATWNH